MNFDKNELKIKKFLYEDIVATKPKLNPMNGNNNTPLRWHCCRILGGLTKCHITYFTRHRII